MGIIIALISGALMSIQGVWNTEVTKQSSQWVTNCWVQGTAFLLCLGIWFFSGRDSFSKLFQVQNKWLLLGGVAGVFITMTVIKSTAALGPAQAVMLIVITQLIVSYLIEIFGLWGVEKVSFEWKRLLGLALSIVGIIIFKWE